MPRAANARSSVIALILDWGLSPSPSLPSTEYPPPRLVGYGWGEITGMPRAAHARAGIIALFPADGQFQALLHSQ